MNNRFRKEFRWFWYNRSKLVK